MKDKYDIKKDLKIILGVIVTAVAVYFAYTALEGLHPSDMFDAQINWWFAGASALVFAGATVLRALVYTYGIDSEMTFMEAWRIVVIGNATNMILPLRAGEGVRLAVFPKRYSAARRAKLALIPGFADIGMILLLSILAIYVANFKEQYYVLILKVASYGFLAVCALIFIIMLCIKKTREEMFSYFNRGTAKMFLWVALSWVVMIFSIWLGFVAFGYGMLRSITLTFGAFAGMNIASLIPSSPGSIGIFEYSVIVGLRNLGISEIPAKTAGLMLHIIQYAALIPLGIILYLSWLWVNRKRRDTIFSKNSSRYYSTPRLSRQYRR